MNRKYLDKSILLFTIFLLVAYYFLYYERYSIWLYHDPFLTHGEVERFTKKAIMGEHQARHVLSNYFNDTDERARELLDYTNRMNQGNIIKIRLANLLEDCGTEKCIKEAIDIYKSIAFWETTALNSLANIYKGDTNGIKEDISKQLYYKKVKDCYDYADGLYEPDNYPSTINYVMTFNYFLTLNYLYTFRSIFFENYRNLEVSESFMKRASSKEKIRTALILISLVNEKYRDSQHYTKLAEKISEKLPKDEYNYIVANYQKLFLQECEPFYKLREASRNITIE